MTLELFSFLLTTFFLAIASYTDLKERIVQDKISYGMAAAGILLHAFFSFTTNNYWLLAISVGVTVATFIASYFLLKAGVWAGGDVKLFTGIAALNPYNPNILNTLGIADIELMGTFQQPIFPLTVFIFSVFAMMPLALAISAKKALRKKIGIGMLFTEKKKTITESVQSGIFLAGISFLPTIPYGTIVAAIAAIAYLFLKGNGKKITAMALFAIALFISPVQAILLAGALALFFALLHYTVGVFSGAKKMLREKKKITELTEGTIPAETILEREGKIERIQALEFENIAKMAVKGNLRELQKMLRPEGRVIASHRMARGLTEEEIAELKELVRNKKLENHIGVKESTAFVPAVLIAYLSLNLIGDILWNILLKT